MAASQGRGGEVANGAALASFLGAGSGAFAMGVMVILNEAGLFVAPALYAPAGGVSGRTTLAALIWVIGWVVLHRRWKGRQIESRRVYAVTILLRGLGVFLTFPLVWKFL
jgi:hypothetical protein